MNQNVQLVLWIKIRHYRLLVNPNIWILFTFHWIAEISGSRSPFLFSSHNWNLSEPNVAFLSRSLWPTSDEVHNFETFHSENLSEKAITETEKTWSEEKFQRRTCPLPYKTGWIKNATSFASMKFQQRKYPLPDKTGWIKNATSSASKSATRLCSQLNEKLMLQSIVCIYASDHTTCYV